MHPERPRLPAEAIELYNRYIHGEIGRRDFLDGVTRFAVADVYPGAVHGFNNDATPERYNKAAADQAWQRTIDWFNKYVRA